VLVVKLTTRVHIGVRKSQQDFYCPLIWVEHKLFTKGDQLLLCLILSDDVLKKGR